MLREQSVCIGLPSELLVHQREAQWHPRAIGPRFAR
jgi:hypothetical protein